MKKEQLLLFAFPFLIIACSPQEQQKAADAIMEQERDDTVVVDLRKSVEPDDSMMEDEGMMMEETAYLDYEDGVIGNGKSSVLFFAAGWCPKCQAHDQRLREWYASEDFPVSVYKVDYDTSSSLKSRYGIVQQHTFVHIDGEGNLIKLTSFPSDAGLRAFLAG